MGRHRDKHKSRPRLLHDTAPADPVFVQLCNDLQLVAGFPDDPVAPEFERTAFEFMIEYLTTLERPQSRVFDNLASVNRSRARDR